MNWGHPPRRQKSKHANSAAPRSLAPLPSALRSPQFAGGGSLDFKIFQGKGGADDRPAFIAVQASVNGGAFSTLDTVAPGGSSNSATLAGVDLSSLGLVNNSLDFRLSFYNPTPATGTREIGFGPANNDFIVITAVPEPSTIRVAICGCFMLLIFTRQRLRVKAEEEKGDKQAA